MKDSETELLARKFRDRFEQSVDALDAATLSEIARVRHRALERARQPARRPALWLPAGALVTACLAIVMYSGLLPRGKVEQKTFIDEIEIVSELDLYEDLEFYEWLEQNQIPS